MKLQERAKLEKLLENVDTGFIPKELVVSAIIMTKEGEQLSLTPDEYEEFLMREAENAKMDPYGETNMFEMRLMLDLEKINKLLKKYTREIMVLFKE